jgi:hypothetical protein
MYEAIYPEVDDSVMVQVLKSQAGNARSVTTLRMCLKLFVGEINSGDGCLRLSSGV